MGRKGWAGSPPTDDEAAVQRIVAATVAHVQENGAAHTTMSAIADDLGITRRTLYRYFANIDDLFRAVALQAFATYQARLEEATASISEPGEFAIEAVAWIVETLPEEPLLTLLLQAGHTDAFTESMMAPEVIANCREILLLRQVDWSTVAATERDLDDLVEFMLRLIQSLVISPPQPPRSGAELRAFLRRWLEPALSQPSA